MVRVQVTTYPQPVQQGFVAAADLHTALELEVNSKLSKLPHGAGNLMVGCMGVAHELVSHMRIFPQFCKTLLTQDLLHWQDIPADVLQFSWAALAAALQAL